MSKKERNKHEEFFLPFGEIDYKALKPVLDEKFVFYYLPATEQEDIKKKNLYKMC